MAETVEPARASFWAWLFNTISVIGLIWTGLMMLVLVHEDRTCAPNCDDPGNFIIWILYGLLWAPPWFISLGAVLADSKQRKFQNVRTGVAALALTFAIMGLTVLYFSTRQPSAYHG